MATAFDKHLAPMSIPFLSDDKKEVLFDSILRWTVIAKDYIYQLTGDENFKSSSELVLENFKNKFSSYASTIDKIDYEIHSLINSRNLVDFLFSKKDAELRSRIGKKFDFEKQIDFEMREAKTLNRLKAEFEANQKIKLSDLTSAIFKKSGFVRNFFGRSDADIRFSKEYEFSIYLKYKLSEALEDEKSLTDKFQIDYQLLRITSEIYRLMLIRINKEGEDLYGVKVTSGGARQKKQLISYLLETSTRIKKMGCIYAAFTVDDGKWYVGQTIGNPYNRWNEHQLNKTGPFRTGAEKVSWHILESGISGSELNAREAFWIKEKNAYLFGHNRTKGNS
jgi:hypothetical protein